LYLIDFENVSIERLSTEPKDFIEINIKKKGIDKKTKKKRKLKINQEIKLNKFDF